MIKIRNLRQELRQLGFVPRSGRGSHEVWVDPAQPRRRVVLNGTGGRDALKYQTARVRKFQRGMMVYH